MSRWIAMVCVLAGIARPAIGVEKAVESHVRIANGVIEFFADNPVNGVIVREQIRKKLWVDGVRHDGKTRQIRIMSLMGGRSKPTTIKFRYPFGDASATWNMPVQRQGDIVTAEVQWRGILIGDIMDVNEGDAAAHEARTRLGVAGAVDDSLPVLYSSGDSISLGYWPYLEGELFGKVNVYFQNELGKDMPEIKLRNNGDAKLAYGVLQEAYKRETFKPDYLLVNFGLHMINAYHGKIKEYGEWVAKFAALAKEKGTRLIWVTTTPYKQSFRPKQNLTIIAFNKIAEETAREHGVPVIDLHAHTLQLVEDRGEQVVYTDGVHFREEVKKSQAAYIAKRVVEIMESK